MPSPTTPRRRPRTRRSRSSRRHWPRYSARAPSRAQAAPHRRPPAGAGRRRPRAAPYMGWTSWSMQSSKYPGLNPDGDYSYLTEANVLKQADALATKLKPYGYEYVNIDAGWWRDNDWVPRFDQYGRQTPDPVRFPRGMKAVADHIHGKGLKAGIYLPVGLEKEAYADGAAPIWNAPGCTTADIVYPDLRTTNGWDSAYKLNFDNPCAQKYIDSQAQLFADWGYDFLKLDGVGPGSFKSGDNYDNVADVAAWQQAIAATGRPIHLELSWSLDIRPRRRLEAVLQRAGASTPTSSATATPWSAGRTRSTTGWTTRRPGAARPAPAGGTTSTRSTSATARWTASPEPSGRATRRCGRSSKSPLYTGDDLTRLDDYGSVAADQPRGHRRRPERRPARPAGHPRRRPAGLGREEPRRQLHRRAVQPRRRARVRHRRTGRPSGSPATPRSATCGTTENLGTQKNEITAGAARARLAAVHRRPGTAALASTGYEAEAAGQHPDRQRLRRRLRRLLRRQEGRQPLRRRHAAVQRRHRTQGRHLHRRRLLRQR